MKRMNFPDRKEARQKAAETRQALYQKLNLEEMLERNSEKVRKKIMEKARKEEALKEKK